MSLYRPKFIKKWWEIRKEGGLKLLFKKKGWQVVITFFMYYLIRDSILYIIIPYFGFTAFKGCF